jgi:hypothetical protein
MATPSSCRNVKLVRASDANRQFVTAQVYRDYPLTELDNIEARWETAREQAAAVGQVAGLAPLEHEHWDWRNKADSVEAGHHMLVAVECDGEAQGLMAVLRTPRSGRLDDGQLVYVDYLESAPWNLKSSVNPPLFVGVGTVLIAEAIRLSLEMGLHGRVGLHSLPQAEAFYTRCRMTKVGPDLRYYDLTYFEYTGQLASDWLVSIGEFL